MDSTLTLGLNTDSPRNNWKFDHSVNSSSHSVNGDIAIQWEWSNFDHS